MLKTGYRINPKTGRQIKIGGPTDLKLKSPKKVKTPSPKKDKTVLDRIYFKGDTDPNNTGIVGVGNLSNGIEVVVLMGFDRKNPNNHSVGAKAGLFQVTLFKKGTSEFLTIPKPLMTHNFDKKRNSFVVDRNGLIELLNIFSKQ